MTELTEFLMARISEDESAVPPEYASADYGSGFNADPIAFEVSPRRWLAECGAKRQIVEDFEEYAADYRTAPSEFAAGRRHAALLAVTRAAAVYADHPDYREEWTP